MVFLQHIRRLSSFRILHLRSLDSHGTCIVAGASDGMASRKPGVGPQLKGMPNVIRLATLMILGTRGPFTGPNIGATILQSVCEYTLKHQSHPSIGSGNFENQENISLLFPIAPQASHSAWFSSTAGLLNQP